MKAYRKFVAIAAVLSAASAASAQAVEGGGAQSPSAWPTYPNERHVLVRLMGGDALRLNDPYGAGVNTPPFVMVDAHVLFLNAGNFHLGPSLGVTLGFNGSHASGVQPAITPGWTAHYRLNRSWGFTGRFTIPIVITNGVSDSQSIPGMNGHMPVFAPVNSTTAVGAGGEIGVGAAYYFLSGFAVTAEINGGLYFGDSFYTFPYIGAAVGLMLDYEILP